MELPRQELLGDAALALNPCALEVAFGSGARARVSARGEPREAELRAYFGPGLRIDHTQDVQGHRFVAEFDLGDRDLAERSSAPGARALHAAAMARASARTPPRILGILNVTPDSFSDGGQWDDPTRAVERALEMLRHGADAIDIGGESTRPGATPVTLEEERRRVLPVIRELARKTQALISVDTTKARLAAEALDLGAGMVNDISAGRFDPEMLPLVARRGAGLALMHMQGTPQDMQVAPRYSDVVEEVTGFLRERASSCWRAGIAAERLWIDPGFGFGKTLEHNLQLLARLGELRSLGLTLLVGPSRKSFIGAIDKIQLRPGSIGPADRIGGTAAALAACVQGGADWLRVHDVATMAQAARVAWAITSR